MNMLRWCYAIRLFRVLLVVAPAALAGCGSNPPRPEVPKGEACLQLFERIDEQIDSAGVADAGYARIPGFPYLRSDRFSASFASEVTRDMDTFWEWVGYLRANEDEARDIELRNLNLGEKQASTTLIDLRGCGGWLRSWELDDAAFRAHLLSLVRPPDEYSTLARTLGLFPLWRPLLERSERRAQEEVLNRYALPVEALPVHGELVLWSAEISEDYLYETLDLRDKPRDRLGRIGMLESEIVQMAQYHAPQLWIDTVDDRDLPGVPRVGDARPGVDVQDPVVYYRAGYTRFGGRNLLQLSYFIWFDRHTSEDGAAGPLDGLIWRVTFGDDGRPMIHDTIHADGSEHVVFPVLAMERREQPADRSALLMPQGQVPAGSIALRIATGSHRVDRVLAKDAPTAATRLKYRLRPYEDLLLLPLPGGGTRSLFDPDGRVAGTERRERFWSWPSGVSSRGAVRQWGRHPISLVRRVQFDDPFLFERGLVAPGAAPANTSPASIR